MKNLTWSIVGILFFAFANDVNAQTASIIIKHKPVFAKFGKGVNFIAEDSSMSLKLGARFQTLFVAEKPLVDGAPVEKELMVRRFRLKMDGFAFTPRLEYKIELALSNRDDGPIMPQAAN